MTLPFPPPFLAALRADRDDPLDRIEETHVSWVALTERHAYKVKKPVDLGFLDYSTPQLRERCCREELRLNRRTAPDHYVGVVDIGDGEVAVKMRRFGPLLRELAGAGSLGESMIDRLVAQVGAFHRNIPAAGPEEDFGTAAVVGGRIEANFATIGPLLPESERELRERLDRLAILSRGDLARLGPLVEQRRIGGHVRECHGDLHLGNIGSDGGEPVIFDAIEFSDQLRWIDTASEAAFLIMDLHARGCPRLALRALTLLFEEGGDDGMAPLLPLYLRYRAMVRAKIALIRWSQEEPEKRGPEWEEFLRYVGTAETIPPPVRPFLLVMEGAAGSGKSTLALRLAERLGAIRVRSDRERMRLYPDPTPREVRYGEAANRVTHETMYAMAGRLLDAGYPVILDATFLRRAHRDEAYRVARNRQLQYALVACRADPAVADARIAAGRGSDPSEAGPEVAARQRLGEEPPGEDEPVVAVETSAAPDLAEVLAQLAARGITEG